MKRALITGIAGQDGSAGSYLISTQPQRTSVSREEWPGE